MSSKGDGSCDKLFRDGILIYKKVTPSNRHGLYHCTLCDRTGNVLRTETMSSNQVKRSEVWHFDRGVTYVKKWFDNGQIESCGYFNAYEKKDGKWMKWTETGVGSPTFYKNGVEVPRTPEREALHNAMEQKHRKECSERMPITKQLTLPMLENEPSGGYYRFVHPMLQYLEQLDSSLDFRSPEI
jgi:hypothetical protein